MTVRRCEVCGSEAARLFLKSDRLDGPLVRCPVCGLLYVGVRSRDFTFAAPDPERSRLLGEKVNALGIVDRALEESDAVREQALERDRDRLEHLLRFAPAGGRLLDVGAAAGGFVSIAGGAFRARGVEPDPATATAAHAQGLDVVNASLAELDRGERYDAITLLHVIEHLDSPRAAVEQIAGLLRPGGVVLIETPTVENLWFALAPGRWRQLIPDHYWFFSARTLTQLIIDCGLRPLNIRTVGRRVPLGFAADRLRRAGIPGAGLLSQALNVTGAAFRTAYLNPGDILQVVANLPVKSTKPQLGATRV